MKSEADEYSLYDLKATTTGRWDGVHNYQARNFMKEMKAGDLIFFYHTYNRPCIVGTMKVIREFYPDPKDESGKFVALDVQYESELKHPVYLKNIKANVLLQNMPLISQSRLSVMPVTPHEWVEILRMSQA